MASAPSRSAPAQADDVANAREVPRWARPSPTMDAQPLTVSERAKVLEQVVAIAMAYPQRRRRSEMFPPFRTLRSRPE